MQAENKPSSATSCASHCYALDWNEGCPIKCGSYLFRIPKPLELSGTELVLELSKPTAYDWFVVRLVRDEENQWLEYVSPRDGSTRVACSEFGQINVWWAALKTRDDDIMPAFFLAIGSRDTARDLADVLRERDRETAESFDSLAENLDRIAEITKASYA